MSIGILISLLYLGIQYKSGIRFDEITYLKGRIIDIYVEEGVINQDGVQNPSTNYFVIADEQNNTYKGIQLVINKNWQGKQGIVFKCRKNKKDYNYYAIAEEDFK